MSEDHKQPLCDRWTLVQALGDQKTANAISAAKATEPKPPVEAPIERFTVYMPRKYTKEEMREQGVPGVAECHALVHKRLTEKLHRAVNQEAGQDTIREAHKNLRDFEAEVLGRSGDPTSLAGAEILDKPTLPPEATLPDHHTADEVQAWNLLAPKTPGL
jgi:hypothetical protein